jgi:DNA-binding NarL/FixJ family response regulator
VFLVSADERADIVDALTAGARAVLPDTVGESEIEAAVRAARSGLVVLHPTIVRRLAVSGGDHADARPSPDVHLTRRELEVLNLLADGLGNKHIATRLGISDHTVKAHLAAIFEKLGASTRTEAVMAGARLGLVTV